GRRITMSNLMVVGSSVKASARHSLRASDLLTFGIIARGIRQIIFVQDPLDLEAILICSDKIQEKCRVSNRQEIHLFGAEIKMLVNADVTYFLNSEDAYLGPEMFFQPGLTSFLEKTYSFKDGREILLSILEKAFSTALSGMNFDKLTLCKLFEDNESLLIVAENEVVQSMIRSVLGRGYKLRRKYEEKVKQLLFSTRRHLD
ncbi:MAG: hypothetical protein NT091_02815, partial [Candidatus Falkowbacteria bacterium]|nr:hypothetical protein [Candidatus Falkowbacteria bacterium]